MRVLASLFLVLFLPGDGGAAFEVVVVAPTTTARTTRRAAVPVHGKINNNGKGHALRRSFPGEGSIASAALSSSRPSSSSSCRRRTVLGATPSGPDETAGDDAAGDVVDTVRVRIWRALAGAGGKELTLKQLGASVGERRTGELRDHLKHVEKQSRTLPAKSTGWKTRRGLAPEGKKTDRLRVRIRRGPRNELYIRLA